MVLCASMGNTHSMRVTLTDTKFTFFSLLMYFKRFIRMSMGEKYYESTNITSVEASRGAAFPLKKLNIEYFRYFALVSRHSAALFTTTQHAMTVEFGSKWRTEYYHNARFSLPTLLCAVDSEKLIITIIIIKIILSTTKHFL